MAEFKNEFDKLQPFEGVDQKGDSFLKGDSDNCLHYVCMMKKSGFVVLDTLSGNVRDLPPLKMSKNNTSYFNMNMQVESGDLKWVVYFNKQRYELFRKVNNSDTEGVVIKKPLF